MLGYRCFVSHKCKVQPVCTNGYSVYNVDNLACCFVSFTNKTRSDFFFPKIQVHKRNIIITQLFFAFILL